MWSLKLNIECTINLFRFTKKKKKIYLVFFFFFWAEIVLKYIYILKCEKNKKKYNIKKRYIKVKKPKKANF